MTHNFSYDAFRQEAARFTRTLTPRDTQATVIALEGDLGAGKTTFTQAVAQALGVKDEVISPTFIIQKVYALEGQAFKRLVHIDAYRLEASRELAVLGWDELLRDREVLVCLEWPERVADLIPAHAHHVHLRYSDDDTRSIEYTHDKTSTHDTGSH